MAYKTLSTVLTHPGQPANHLAAAADLALGFDAHLDVICAGIDASRPEMAFPESLPSLDAALIEQAKTDAKDLEQDAASLLTRLGCRYEPFSVVVTPGGLPQAVVDGTLLTDLVVLPRPYGPDAPYENEAIAEAALFNGPVPICLVPPGVDSISGRGPVVIGWNETPQSLAAVRGAMPFLKAADVVHIAMVAPPVHGPERSDPGGRLARMLSRHGVRAEIRIMAQTMPRASDELLRHAHDIDATMMVVGAYGHSRLREAVFGGATRNLLREANIPLLMSR